MRLKFRYILYLSMFLIYSCLDFQDTSNIRITDYRKYETTPIAELANSVDEGDTVNINQFLKTNPNFIDYQEPYHRMSLLMMTIQNQRRATFPYSMICDNENCGLSINQGQRNSFLCLLNNGASTEITNAYGETPLLMACACDYYDAVFVKDLINHGADVNYILPEKYADRLGNSTALQNAIRCRNMECIKLLLENGADVNFMDKYKNTPLGMSLYDNEYIVTLYLLEKGADYTMPVNDMSIHTGNIEDTCRLTLLEELRYRVHPLGSEEHKQKMQIVRFLSTKGVDYKKVKIPDIILQQIKKKYPNTWKEVIGQY